MTPSPSPRRPLRRRVPIAALVLAALAYELPIHIEDGPAWLWMISAFGPLLAMLVLVLWWSFLSGATVRERLGGVLGVAVLFVATMALADPSLRQVFGPMRALPMGLAGFALGLILATGQRARTLVAVALAGAAMVPALTVRSVGMRGDFRFDLHSRFHPSSEELFLAELEEEAASADSGEAEPAHRAELGAVTWPCFRGARRDGVTNDPRVTLDEGWDVAPPRTLWSTRVGPGWSSFAIAGDSLFTLEQRGDREATVALDATTGESLWVRTIDARFEDPLGGPGPRATPTISDGALYVLGATGNLARLDPITGAVAWSVELTTFTELPPPDWGFASSPLVLGDLVVVYASGPAMVAEDAPRGVTGALAFATATGALAWTSETEGQSYGSPQLGTFDGRDVILMQTGAGLYLVDPKSGEQRLAYDYPYEGGYRVVQPLQLGNDVLVAAGAGSGTRRIHVTVTEGADGDAWSAEELWTSRSMKPDFNDMVARDGYLFGFDGGIFACVDLATGERAWKGGRYGKGQVLLVEPAGALVVLAESGEAVLVAADPSGHRELGRYAALDGKTWNHPVVVDGVLYARNAESAVAVELAPPIEH